MVSDSMGGGIGFGRSVEGSAAARALASGTALARAMVYDGSKGRGIRSEAARTVA